MTTIGNIEIDIENTEFNNAAEFVRHTDKLVYLTGKAGTGKTTFLKYIRDTTEKNTVILAPTGVAAINAGGITINSFFQIPFAPFVPDDTSIFSNLKYKKEKLEIIKNLELLIIDEISMVRCDKLDLVDRILKVIRRKPNLPFGGVQVILIGDTFQLPPIAKKDEWEILSQFYNSPFFFSSKVIEDNPPVNIELKKIYRQKEQDFIDLLDRVRVNKVTRSDYELFKRLKSKYSSSIPGNGNDYITLATHKSIVNEINLTKLEQIDKDLFTYEARVTGQFSESNMPTDQYLKLKEGAQVMFVKNDATASKRYFNGKLGKIKALRDNEITVIFDDETGETEINLERTIWNNIQYAYNKEKKKIEEEVIGTFEQFPIKLAWAITVNKSQGLTFDKVIADLNEAFDFGQVYVALSRCRSLNGLILKTDITPGCIKTDPRVIEFAKHATPETLVTKQLTEGKADFLYKKARIEFEEGNFEDAYNNFLKAIKFRNDIETEGFKRFIILKLERLFSFQTSSFVLRNRIEEYEDELEEAKSTIESKSSLIKEIGDENERLIRMIAGFMNEADQAKFDLERQKDDNTILTQQLSDIKNQNFQLKQEIKSLKIILGEEIKKNRMREIEIERFQNLKWYNRLLGTK